MRFPLSTIPLSRYSWHTRRISLLGWVARQFAQATQFAEDGALAAGWLVNLDLDRSYEFSRQFEAKVDALTPEELLDVARCYLDPAKMTVVVAGDVKKGAQ